MDEYCKENCQEIRVLSSSDTGENSKQLEHFTSNAALFLKKCFQIVGTLPHSNNDIAITIRLKTGCFSLFMHIALITNIILLITSISTGNWDIKIALACASTNIFSAASWYSMKSNSDKLHLVLQEITTITREIDITFAQIVVKLSLAVFLAIPIVYAVVCAAYYSDTSFPSFWLYGSTVQSMHPYGIVLLFFNVFFYISLQTLFPGLCACAYCFLCYAVYKCLKKCELTIKSTFADIVWKIFVTQYFSVLSAAEMLNSCFSVPIFLIILMHVLHMFSLLASFLTYKKEQFSIPFICEALIILVTSVPSTLFIIIFASLVSDQAGKLRRRCKRILEEIVLEKNTTDLIIQLAVDRDIIPMTACNVVTLQKRLILPLFGALLTYGFLVMQINK